MSTTPDLVARVEALEKAVQSLLGAVKILETIQENGSRKPAGKATSTRRKTSATKVASKERSGKKAGAAR